MEERDVIVVGAGPAGSVAAKKCAGYGLKTLMLEKKQLPRDKVCSGMIMGPVAHSLIKQEFGDIPEAILCQPPCLRGIILHVPSIGSEKLENFTPLTWRRNIDYWMNQKAQSEGAEIWQGVRITSIEDIGQGFLVRIQKDSGERQIKSKFIIGADGATSLVRKFLFPNFKLRYAQAYEEWYSGESELDKEYFHWFFPLELSPLSFCAYHKDNIAVIEATGGVGQVKKTIEWAKGFLGNNYGFRFAQKPVWRGGCLEPIMYRELTSYTFLPAKGNALLVGDAAGFLMPITGEGIGTALKSGLLGAASIIEAMESGRQLDSIYLAQTRCIVDMFEEIYPWFRRIIDEAKAGGQSLPALLSAAYRSTLREF